jgi:hypothetical protein
MRGLTPENALRSRKAAEFGRAELEKALLRPW